MGVDSSCCDDCWVVWGEVVEVPDSCNVVMAAPLSRSLATATNIAQSASWPAPLVRWSASTSCRNSWKSLNSKAHMQASSSALSYTLCVSSHLTKWAQDSSAFMYSRKNCRLCLVDPMPKCFSMASTKLSQQRDVPQQSSQP